MKRNNVEYRIRCSERKIRFGDKIRQLREKQGLKQVDIANKLNMTTASISNIEAGEQAVYVHDLPEWATVFKCKITDLITEKP